MNLKPHILSLCMMLMALPAYMAGQGVIVSSGIYMKMSGGTLVLHGNWVNNGNYADTTGTIILNDTTQQVIGGDSSTQFHNMTINNTAGVVGSNDFTVGGILNLESANASDTVGTLDMGANILTMDSSATTIGAGDVTGVVKRVSFVAFTAYSFGNQFTTLTFSPGGTYPTQIQVKIRIGSAPAWKTDGVKRTYDLIQNGESGSFVSMNLHYLDNELNGNTENMLVHWDGQLPSPPGEVMEHGKYDYNLTNNWVGCSNMETSYFMTSFGTEVWTLGNSALSYFTWNGSISTDWLIAANWTPSGNPSYLNIVVIPDSVSTPNDPILPAVTGIKNLTIEEAGILNSDTNAQLSIYGSSGSWVDFGTFNCSTGNVIFLNAFATIAGTTNFYNVTIDTGASLRVTNGNIMRIAGSMTNNGAWHTVVEGRTTVDYNGGAQTVVIPNPATTRYSNLILSGSGTKTMPDTTLSIYGDFSMSGTATTTAGEAMTVAGNFNIGSDAAFTTGAYNHSIGGNFSNNGTFTATGSTITCNGSAAQTIGGTTATTFNKLTINNTTGVTLTSDTLTTVSDTLRINTGKKLKVAPGKQLTAMRTITNNAGSSGFVLQSDTAGTASLLHNLNNVPATCERYISGDAEAWHFLSSPVAAQSISGSWLPSGSYGNGTGYDLYVWNEPSSCWIYKLNVTSPINWQTVHPGSDFTPGRGYLYSVQALNPTKAFAGNLNNGAVSYGLTFSSSDVNLKGFNLVGNPFPSSSDWQATSGWTRSNLVSTGGGYDMWIWNPAANNYGVFNSATGIGTNSATRYIAPMQGYFVQAGSAGNLDVNNNVRVHDGAGSWFKDAGITPARLSVVVKAETDKSFDEVNLLFGYTSNQPGATKLFSRVATAPSLFMPSGSDYCSVRYLTDTISNPMVPVMFKPGNDGNYTLSCNFENREFEIVMLEDRQRHYIQNMKLSNTYHFQSSTQDDVSRFILHFGPDNNASYDELPARIYTDGMQLIIDLTLVGKETEASVCDVLGRLILQKKLQGSSLHKLSINIHSQILIIYLKNQQGRICRKLFFNTK